MWVDKENDKCVHTYDLKHLDSYLNTISLMFEYFADIVFEHTEKTIILYNHLYTPQISNLYNEMFPLLNYDIHRCIFKHAYIPYFQEQKKINEAPEEIRYSLENIKKKS